MKTDNVRVCIHIICFAVILFFVSSSAAGDALPFAKSSGIMMPDDVPYTAELSVSVKKHVPFGEERTEWLDRLLKHVCLRLSGDGNREMLTFLTDGTEVFTIIQEKENEETRTAVLPISEKVYTGESFLMSDGDDLTGDVLLGATGKEHLYLEDLLHLFESLPAEFGDVCADSRINSKIKGYGTVRNKKTITIASEQADTLSGRLSGMCDTEELAGLFSTLAFTGKQNIRLMYDDEWNLIKIVYDGHLNDRNGFRRNVSLTWQHCGGETEKNKLTIKTPRNDGKGRNNFVIDESVITGGDTQQWKADYKYEAVADGKKTVTEISADISETCGETLTTLKGNIIISRKQSGGDGMKSEIGIDAEIGKTRTGTLSVRTSRENTVLEDAAIFFTLNEGAVIPDLSGYETAALDQSARDRLTEETAAYLVRSFVLLPREDTLLLSGDMPDETWQKIVDAAATPVKEEEIP